MVAVSICAPIKMLTFTSMALLFILTAGGPRSSGSAKDDMCVHKQWYFLARGTSDWHSPAVCRFESRFLVPYQTQTRSICQLQFCLSLRCIDLDVRIDALLNACTVNMLLVPADNSLRMMIGSGDIDRSKKRLPSAALVVLIYAGYLALSVSLVYI